MKIALDAMGGDYAPAVVIEGAVAAARECGLELMLVGPQTEIEAELAQYHTGGLALSIVHASEVVGMAELPTATVRAKKDSSIVVGLNLVKKGEAQAFVSAGNTGAIAAAALLGLGRIPGIKRPGLAIIYPALSGPSLVIDIGANADCRPEHLLQFGIMGAIYVEKVLAIPQPKVALLSIGEEAGKGNALMQESYGLLERSGLNFIGNVEGKDVPTGLAQVIVCDGFTGNVVLKLSEGVAMAVVKLLREEIKRRPLALLGAALARPALREAQRRMDYAEQGGALLLGTEGVVIIGHGRSNSKAIKNACRMAQEAARADIVSAIKRGIAEYREAS